MTFLDRLIGAALGVMLGVSLTALVVLLTGCAVHIGPSPDKGWMSWDVCGWEGGVSSTLTVMGGNSWKLGCTHPPETTTPEEPPAPPVQLPPDDGS